MARFSLLSVLDKFSSFLNTANNFSLCACETLLKKNLLVYNAAAELSFSYSVLTLSTSFHPQIRKELSAFKSCTRK